MRAAPAKLLVSWLLAACLACQPEPAAEPLPSPVSTPLAEQNQSTFEVRDARPDDALPPPSTHYRGREIAQTMHWKGAEWLMRETREKEENGARMLEALDVQPGWTVCDLGCGNGYHTLPLARLVGSEGRVYAVDIQPEMLDLLAERAEAVGIENIERVLGGPADPNLPAASCDLILLVDVYHELSHPERMLRAIRRALKPGGRLVLVEFRAEDPDVPIKPLHKMSKAQILAELVPNGFELVETFDELPWQHVMLFGSNVKAEGPQPRASSPPAKKRRKRSGTKTTARPKRAAFGWRPRFGRAAGAVTLARHRP